MNHSLEVKELLAEIWHLPPSQIPDEASLNGFDKWDSLGHISIILALEARFQIPVNEETIQSLNSLPRIVAFLQNQSTPKC